LVKELVPPKVLVSVKSVVEAAEVMYPLVMPQAFAEVVENARPAPEKTLAEVVEKPRPALEKTEALVVLKAFARYCAPVRPERVPAKLLEVLVNESAPLKVFTSVRSVEEAAFIPSDEVATRSYPPSALPTRT
jgi:hypothetical protein